MAKTEDQFTANSRSPRYGTSKSLGFRGGSQNASGNLQTPTYDEVRGQRPPATPDGQETAAIRQFSAQATPQIPSTAKQVAGAAGSAAAGEAAKFAGKKAGGFVSNLFDGPSSFAGAADGAISSTPNYLAGGGRFPSGAGEGVGGSVSTTSEFANAPNYAESALFGDGAGAAGDIAGGAADFATGGAELVDGAGSLYDAADAAQGAELFGAATDGADFAEAGVPYIGSALRLAQGDYKGAALTAAGTAIAGPIGGIIGGALSSACFITEAVTSAGGQDNGEELNTLRWFRDNILMANPQGQALVQEYVEMAPMVVEAISMRPDALQLFQQIKSEFIDQAVAAVKSGNYKAALEIYAQMIAFVEPFAAEQSMDEINEPGEADAMGSHAAMLAHDDMATAEIAPGGPGNTDWQSMEQHGGGQPQPGQMPGGFGAAANMAPPGMQPGNSVPMAQNLPIAQFQPQRRHF